MEEFFATDMKWLAGAFFVGAMLAPIGGLTYFLREVHHATRTVSFDLRGSVERFFGSRSIPSHVRGSVYRMRSRPAQRAATRWPGVYQPGLVIVTSLKGSSFFSA